MKHTLKELLNEHYNDYVRINSPYWDKEKMGYDWLIYYGEDIDIWDVDEYSRDGGDWYDVYISIR